MGQNELLRTIHELKGLKQMKEELDAEITATEDAIKSEMTARGVDELKVGIFKVCWTKIISRRFDTAAFKDTHADIYNLFSKTTETKRFSIA